MEIMWDFKNSCSDVNLLAFLLRKGVTKFFDISEVYLINECVLMNFNLLFATALNCLELVVRDARLLQQVAGDWANTIVRRNIARDVGPFPRRRVAFLVQDIQ